MHKAGTIDEVALSKHISAVAASAGLAGLLINGHAGENHQLQRHEKRLVLEIARESVAEKLIVAGINCEDSRQAAIEAEDAARAGVDAIMVFPPMSWALGHDPSMVHRHHTIIGASCALPLFLYQSPVGAGRMAYSSEVLRKLLEIDAVVGIKEGSWETATYEANRRLVRSLRPDVGVYASGDEHLFTCFVLGSEGSHVSLAAIWPELVIELDDAVRMQQLSRARALHDRIYPLAKAIYGRAPAYHANARIKACLRLLGRIPDDQVRAPIHRLPDYEVSELVELLQQEELLT